MHDPTCSGVLFKMQKYFEVLTAQKMKCPIRDFFRNVTKSAVSCRFGHIS